MRARTTVIVLTLAVAALPALAQDGPMVLVPLDPPPASPTLAVTPAPVFDAPLNLDPTAPAIATQSTSLAPPAPRFNPRRLALSGAAGGLGEPRRIDTDQPLARPETLAAEEALRRLAEKPASATLDGLLPLLTSAPSLAAGSQGQPSAVALNSAPGSEGFQPDLAYGAFQRGYYLSAFRLAVPLAEAGNVAAQTLLGLIYEGGYGVPQDHTEAAAWYKISAAGGDREAQFALGMMYQEGRGVELDLAQAADYLESAANGGKTAAKYNVGLIYLKGLARPVDAVKAAALLDQAATAGSMDAQYVLAQLRAEGRAIPLDDVAATRLFGEAARLGHLPAQVEYAIRLFNGKGIQKNEVAAASWFRRAADLGDPVAQNRYARLLAVGRGTSADFVQAAKYHFLSMRINRSDALLDELVAGLTDDQRQAAIAAAQRWPAR
jgi:TPR repeat protein